MVGTAEVLYVNPLFEPVPMGVVTETAPLAPLPTLAVMVAESTTLNEAAATPPKLTAVAPLRLVPLMRTAVPLSPDTGLKLLMVGMFRAVNDTWLP